nr:hypothetical protein Iba_chr04fCG8060 [Ipomoea batatas]
MISKSRGVIHCNGHRKHQQSFAWETSDAGSNINIRIDDNFSLLILNFLLVVLFFFSIPATIMRGMLGGSCCSLGRRLRCSRFLVRFSSTLAGLSSLQSINDQRNLGDFEFVEDILKDLVVLDHLLLVLGIEIDLVHRHHPWMSGIHKLAGNCTGLYLFNFGEIEMESGVDPREDLRSPDESAVPPGSAVRPDPPPALRSTPGPQPHSPPPASCFATGLSSPPPEPTDAFNTAIDIVRKFHMSASRTVYVLSRDRTMVSTSNHSPPVGRASDKTPTTGVFRIILSVRYSTDAYHQVAALLVISALMRIYHKRTASYSLGQHVRVDKSSIW